MTPWKWWDIYSNTPFYSSLVAISLNSAGMELSLLDLHLQYQPKQSPLANLRWSGLRRSLQQFLILNCHSFMTFQPSTSPSSHPRHHHQQSSAIIIIIVIIIITITLVSGSPACMWTRQHKARTPLDWGILRTDNQSPRTPVQCSMLMWHAWLCIFK